MNNIVSLTNDSEDKFITAINTVIPELRPTKMTKIKNYEYQVVIETDDYFYKVYEDKEDIGTYRLEIRQKLAKIYQSYGIHWLIYSFKKDGFIYTVEQRQKLEVCDHDIECKKLLLGWKKTLDLLEKELRFESIRNEIVDNCEQFSNVNKVKLIRDCINKPEDYAYGPNNEIILLDDADWFITLVDEFGNRINSRSFQLDVTTTAGTLTLALSVKELTDRFIYQDLSSADYFLFKYTSKEKNFMHKLVNYHDKMLEDNTKLFCGIDLTEDHFKYQSEYIQDFKLKYDNTKLLPEGERNE